VIIILRDGLGEDQLGYLISWIKSQGLEVNMTVGERQTILGLIGDTSAIDQDLLLSMDIVEDVKRVSEP
jgi:3-deoxy-7-phosphoheptulonate synthase